MNKERRKRIEALQEQIAGIALELEELMNEEQEAYQMRSISLLRVP